MQVLPPCRQEDEGRLCGGSTPGSTCAGSSLRPVPPVSPYTAAAKTPWAVAVGAQFAYSPPRTAVVDRLLRKLRLLEQLLQKIAGVGFTVTSFTLFQLFIEAKPASKLICCRLSFWTTSKHSLYPYTSYVEIRNDFLWLFGEAGETTFSHSLKTLKHWKTLQGVSLQEGTSERN